MRDHPGRWSWRASSGDLAFALVAIAVISGLALAIPFDIRRAYDSLAVLLLTNPAGAFFRNVHYWAGQLFLVLTIVHTWRVLRRATELHLRRGVWLRVATTVPLAAFVMLSGFLLKDDAESRQAVRILSASLESVPLVGRALAASLLGVEGNRQLIYVHHVATASLLLWLFVAEHARALWPRRVALIESFAACAALSLFLSPSLHDGLDPLVKGPWYFLGLQEILHWATRPSLVVFAAAAALGWWLFLPRLSDRWLRVSKWALALALVAYAGLTVVGVFFRGEAWAWGFQGDRVTHGLTAHGLGVWWGPPIDALEKRPVPIVLGRREGCLFCHAGVNGLSASHAADAVGCASCHGGDPFHLHAPTAHAGMILVPGNLDTAERSCGTSSCHPSIVPRVRGSMMNTMAGIIAVDRWVWSSGQWTVDSARTARRQTADSGQQTADSGQQAADHDSRRRTRDADGTVTRATVDELGHQGADSHLRQLCASCHLGAIKAEWGPIDERSRGGGCNACHLTYSAQALRDVERYAKARRSASNSPSTHPNLSLAIGAQPCFGCHSRSGRISTSYEGWMETESGESDQSDRSGQSVQPRQSVQPGQSKFRTLEDGRVFSFVQADVHAEKGMVCVDCHTSREVMGDGVAHARKTDALRVACEDCHFAPNTGRQAGATTPPSISRLRTVSGAQLDDESRKIATLRGRTSPGDRFLVSVGGDPLLNTSIDASGKPWLTTKTTGERLELRAPAAVCLEGMGHARLSCGSCHTAWAPRCTRCHTRFDPASEGFDLLDGKPTRGAWVEAGGGFSAQAPTLGVRTVGAIDKSTNQQIDKSTNRQMNPSVVDTFIPGMIISLDRNQKAGAKPDNVFRRLYARTSSHTTMKGGRTCTSCHNDPVAIGYGEGKLTYERAESPNQPGARGSTEDGKRRTEGGVWRFSPAQPPGPDGLPADAWVGFLQERTVGASTRGDTRPFTVDEQKRILTVGACLTCHDAASPAMGAAVANWKGTLARVSPRCVLPKW